MQQVRIAMAQILVEGGQPDRNLARASAAIHEAASRGCHIIVLPECLNLGWTHPSAHELAMPLPGQHSEQLAQAGRDSGIWVVAGLVERAEHKIFNSAVLLSPAGEMVLRHRKLNELTLAHDVYSLGTSVSVADTPLGLIGVLICADLFPDCLEYGRALARMGCQLLLSPCAWAVPADHDNAVDPYGGLWRDAYGTLTAEFPLTVVGTSNVGRLAEGPWAGRNVIGCSLAMGAGGKLLAEGPYGADAEALLVCEVEVSPQHSVSVSPMAQE